MAGRFRCGKGAINRWIRNEDSRPCCSGDGGLRTRKIPDDQARVAHQRNMVRLFRKRPSRCISGTGPFLQDLDDRNVAEFLLRASALHRLHA